MEWPAFFKDALTVGNQESNVSICTLWTEQKHIISDISNELFAVSGNLYTKRGINTIIKNILANPNIRYIILCGKDITGSGEELINFFHGKDMEGIDNEHQNIVRKNVELIDMRGKENKIKDIIRELPKKERFSEPIIIEEKIIEYPTIVKDNICLTVTGSTITETWLKILDNIMKFGEEKKSEYGIRQKETLNLIAIINGREDILPEWLKMTDEELKKYYLTILSGNKPDDISYTYGERLFRHPLSNVEQKWDIEMNNSINQVQNVIEHLKKKPYTRRAIAFTWNVVLDHDSDHPPCLTQIVWNIKYGKLYQTATIRSNDMYAAWPMNAFALRELQEQISKKIGVPSGSLTIISNSAHIYENNWNDAADIINSHYTGKQIPFIEDILGYFVIRVENNDIIIDHYTDVGKSPYTFTSKSAIELYRRIVHENLISKLDHAAYIGKELARAEECLINNKPYVQDKA